MLFKDNSVVKYIYEQNTIGIAYDEKTFYSILSSTIENYEFKDETFD